MADKPGIHVPAYPPYDKIAAIKQYRHLEGYVNLNNKSTYSISLTCCLILEVIALGSLRSATAGQISIPASKPSIPKFRRRSQAASGTTLYDPAKWSVIRRRRANFGPTLSGCEVLLLKSRLSTDTGGAGQPLYDVHLLVIKESKAIYDYLKEGLKPPDSNGINVTKFLISDTFDHRGDTLDIRDVTSDGVPEIIFHSGFEGASDYAMLNHILRYDRSTMSFTDIGPDEFEESGTQQLRWATIRGHSVAVVARRDWDAWNAETAPEHQCHYCEGPYLYDAYVWDNMRNSFSLYRTLKATKKFGDGESALKTDWPYILANLASAHK